MIKEQKIKQFISKFPDLLPVVEKLNEAPIDWMIGGSSCLFLLGNERMPGDVDIFIPDNQHDEVDELFKIKSYIHNSPAGPVRNSNPIDKDFIQFTSHIEYNFDKHYEFKITKSILNKLISFKYNETTFYLLPPEDVILIKALLQRGVTEGKKDLEDIKNFNDVYKLDKKYLSGRIKELGAENRVSGIF